MAKINSIKKCGLLSTTYIRWMRAYYCGNKFVIESLQAYVADVFVVTLENAKNIPKTKIRLLNT